MKRYFIILLSLITINPLVLSQVNSGDYLFEEFKDAVVYLKNRQHTEEKVNINLVDNKLYFIDKKDKQIKFVSGIENILSVEVEGRVFLVRADAIREIVHNSPTIYVQYTGKSRPKNVTIGYGGSSTLTSTTTYSKFRANDEGTLKDHDRELTGIYHSYWIVKNEKEKKFINSKQFIKLYPKQKREILQEYIKNEDIDFQDIDKVITLCLYAESL